MTRKDLEDFKALPLPARKAAGWLSLGGMLVGLGAGWAMKTEKFAGLPPRVTALERGFTGMQSDVHQLALQVCLLRVEVRHDPNADLCAGLK